MPRTTTALLKTCLSPVFWTMVLQSNGPTNHERAKVSWFLRSFLAIEGGLMVRGIQLLKEFQTIIIVGCMNLT